MLKSDEAEYLICVQRDHKVVCGEDASERMAVLAEIDMRTDAEGVHQEEHTQLSMSKPQQKHYFVRLGVVKGRDWNLAQVGSLSDWTSSQATEAVKFYCNMHYAPGLKSVGKKRMRESLDD